LFIRAPKKNLDPTGARGMFVRSVLGRTGHHGGSSGYVVRTLPSPEAPQTHTVWCGLAGSVLRVRNKVRR